ncbi:hypothetical protein [Catenovulum maritimum]|uniref:Uncharacterized protein n=1 Tax=Catenovulum maritimum TaxID=1513271 RepID=A0A0J8GVY4_9ALTE|nr:hypothetical protein [Catenovulum maritimum]KMT66945.1 hypothetical protein XM47_02270 [Catenovulum maritimum]
MGFKDVKKQLLECLAEGKILHQARNNIDVKNLLETGQISVSVVTDIVKKARGNNYECSPHHMIKSIDVHIIKTTYQNESWYIKWYYVEPNSIFISVHN